MKSFGVASAAAAVLGGVALFANGVQADMDPIVIKGQHFFYKTNGTEFFIRGVAYQQDVGTGGNTGDFIDPLADEAGCKRDIPLIKALGSNTVRVYAIDPTKDHSACMQMLQDNDIYVLQDLSNPSNSINRNDPKWTVDLYAGYAAVIDAMAPYSNTLGFFAGNEVSNQPNNTAASAYVKAAVRDMKAYIKTQGYRDIGVGYATNDDASIRLNLADYFNCGEQDNAIDFWGYNIYSWCGDSSYTKSGYDQRTAEFKNYSVPAFFAEYGCNDPQPRLFTEVQAIYGDQMTPVWSGGIVYEYFQMANDYGLVSVTGDTASKLPDYSALSTQLASATPSSTAASAYSPTNTEARACPTVGEDWAASSNLPPIANADLCDCMVSSLSCVAKSDLTGDDMDELFGYICGSDPHSCDGISSNATEGVYGSYSMCEAMDQLSFAMNQYYEAQDQSSDACDFSGRAQTQSASTAGSCSTLLSQAGESGTGTVTSVPTSTGGSSGGSGSSSGSSSSGSSSASSTSGNAASGLRVPAFDTSVVSVGAYVILAMLTGAGMVLL